MLISLIALMDFKFSGDVLAEEFLDDRLDVVLLPLLMLLLLLLLLLLPVFLLL